MASRAWVAGMELPAVRFEKRFHGDDAAPSASRGWSPLFAISMQPLPSYLEIGSPIKHLRREEAAFGDELRISLQFVPVALLLEREFRMIRVEFANEFIQDAIEYAGTSDLAGFRVAVVVCIRSAHPVQGDDAAAFHVEVELLMGHFQCLLLVGSDFRQAVLDASVQGLFEWNPA